MNQPELFKVRIRYPDGTFAKVSNAFLHQEGFLCKLRTELRGVVRTNWTKREGALVLEMESDQVLHVHEPLICPGKAHAHGQCNHALHERLSECRARKDFSCLLNDEALRPTFFTPGDNGHGYYVEVIN